MGSGRVKIREAEIDDFDVARFGDEDVLNFEVYIVVRAKVRPRSSGLSVVSGSSSLPSAPPSRSSNGE